MHIKHLDSLSGREIVPGYFVKFIHTHNQTFAHWDVQPGAELPMHSHPHEQVCYVLEGEFELTIDDTTYSLEPGKVAVIPSNAKHSGRAITACKILDVFYPIREDYL